MIPSVSPVFGVSSSLIRHSARQGHGSLVAFQSPWIVWFPGDTAHALQEASATMSAYLIQYMGIATRTLWSHIIQVLKSYSTLVYYSGCQINLLPSLFKLLRDWCTTFSVIINVDLQNRNSTGITLQIANSLDCRID